MTTTQQTAWYSLVIANDKPLGTASSSPMFTLRLTRRGRSPFSSSSPLFVSWRRVFSVTGDRQPVT